MMFYRRKVYERLLEWKALYADEYSVLLEGARRVGKSTIAERFAKLEYQSYILIDFANTTVDILKCFDDLTDLDVFFLRLQTLTGKTLIKGHSVIIFDEIQLFPKARQAIKYLIKDGRYHYIETGSLISIKKNVQDILIPSEEIKISVYPMDYEEFCWALDSNSHEMAKNIFYSKKSLGQEVNRKLMRNFRIYMAVGGMPQAVEAYLAGKNFSQIDFVKRMIIRLYEEDFMKIDPSGRISALFHDIPAQLSKNCKRYSIASALEKRKTTKDENLLQELIDSKTVLVSYNISDPGVSLSLTKDPASYKLFISDVGLFISLMFIDKNESSDLLYAKLLSDKLPANLGYLYENVVAQMIASENRELYYHTWKKAGSTHYYEIDFLIRHETKLSAVEVKSSGTGKHESLKCFQKKYTSVAGTSYLISQKDLSQSEDIHFIPVYMTPFILSSNREEIL